MEAQVRFTPQDEQFRTEVREWLEANLTGEFAGLRGAGGPGREHERHDERLAWNRHLAAAGWTCLGWPGRARRPRRDPDPAGHLLRGVRAGRRARPGLDRG